MVVDFKNRIEILNFILFLILAFFALVSMVDALFRLHSNLLLQQYIGVSATTLCFILLILKKQKLFKIVLGLILLAGNFGWLTTLPFLFEMHSKVYGGSSSLTLYNGNFFYTIMLLVFIVANRKDAWKGILVSLKWIYKILPGE